MRTALFLMLSAAAVTLGPADLYAQRVHAAADSLAGFHAVRYENTYTRVPTSGKLVGVRITNKGTTYYICRERGAYVIYHVEIRPIEKLKVKMKAELAKLRREWDRVHPDELLFTKKRFDEEVGRAMRRYSDAVWIRNEVVTGRVSPGNRKRSPGR